MKSSLLHKLHNVATLSTNSQTPWVPAFHDWRVHGFNCFGHIADTRLKCLRLLEHSFRLIFSLSAKHLSEAFGGTLAITLPPVSAVFFFTLSLGSLGTFALSYPGFPDIEKIWPYRTSMHHLWEFQMLSSWLGLAKKKASDHTWEFRTIACSS